MTTPAAAAVARQGAVMPAVVLTRRSERLASTLTLAAAGVHVVLAPRHLEESPVLGVGFVLAAVVLFAVSRLLNAGGGPVRWRLAGGVCAAVAAAYVLSRTTDLLDHSHGWDALGVTTTVGEIVVVALAVTAVRVGGSLLLAPRRHGLRVAVVLGVGAVLLVPGSNPAATASSSTPAGCTETSRTIRLYANELPRTADGAIRLGWGTDPSDPSSTSSPGPLIEMIEGECIAVQVTNNVPEATLAELRASYPGQEDLPLGVSLHVHGVRYTTASDGTLHTGSWVPPGKTRTYIWYAAPRVVTAGRVTSMGTAGYWWYHDHVAGTAHGTGGLDAGLFGGVVVRRAGDLVTPPDRTFTTVFGPTATIRCTDRVLTTSGHVTASDRGCLQAEVGERVEIVAFAVGHDFHTFHLHGHTWAANRTGILTGVDDETPLIDARTLGPSESFGFQIVAGESVGPGMWMLHCHVQAHSDAGMVAFLDVVAPGAAAPLPSDTTDPHTHSHTTTETS